MKKKLALVLAILCVLLLFVQMPSNSPTAKAAPLTSESIKQKEEDLKKAEEEKKKMQSSLADAKEIKKKLEADKNDLRKYVAKLDQNLQEIQENIANLNQQIIEKEAEIARTQEELEKAREKETSQYDSMVQQIQFMYEQGESTYLDMIFNGESISDILNKVEYMERVSEYSKNLLDEYILNRQLIELCEKQLIVEKEILDETKKGVVAEEAALQELIAAKEQTIREYDSSITTKEQAIKEYEEDIKAQNELLEALEAAIAEEKRKILEASGEVISYDGGKFKFPIASYTKVSSDYGMRPHPTLGVMKFHDGVDLAAPTGTAIYAAYDGKVVAAAYNNSMGNYVMIDHGSGLYTIYMHASKLYVKTGAIVIRGETIAAVGSTGRSTGPHLHFGVRLNGEYQSPWNYISK